MGRFLRFHLERWLQRGIWHQLAFVAGLIVLVSIIGGLAAWALSGQFSNPLEAIWWSFLRLTDPGYLGDDDGVALRVISTIVTILGYVLFMGSLIAILTQWLRDTLTRYEEGHSSISMKGHVVIFGGVTRTPEIVRQLVSAGGRLERFLEARGERRLRIVVVADEVDSEIRQRLFRFLGDRHRRGQVYLRAGSATRMGDLARFDLGRAAAVVLPGDEFAFGGAGASDAQVIKSLLNLRATLRRLKVKHPPSVVAEVIDPALEDAAAHAYGGAIEIVPGDNFIAHLLARAVIDIRLLSVFKELLTLQDGCSLFMRDAGSAVGSHPSSLAVDREKVIVLGAVRTIDGRRQAVLNPPPDFRIAHGDEVAYLARSYGDFSLAGQPTAPPAPSLPVGDRTAGERTVLVLGWSGHVARVVADILASGINRLNLTLVSRIPIKDRQGWLKGHGIDAGKLEVTHHEAELLASGSLDAIDLTRHDSVLIASSPFRGDAEESDARVLTVYELIKVLREGQCPDRSYWPHVLLELAYPASAEYEIEPGDQLMLRPRLLGFLQSQVALRPELNAVFDALLLPTNGARITIRTGERSIRRYADLVASVGCVGDLPLGVLLDAGAANERVSLCPADAFAWSGTADLIVLQPANTGTTSG